MKKSWQGIAWLVSVSVSMAVSAQSVKPGLWEVHSATGAAAHMQQAQQQMQAQMAKLSPEQTKMMEKMMSERGVAMSAGAPRICLSKEQIEKKEMPVDQRPDCKTEVKTRSTQRWEARSVCTNPPSTANVVTTFESAEAYSTQIDGTMTRNGKTEPYSMGMKMRWVSADCGTLKPVGMGK